MTNNQILNITAAGPAHLASIVSSRVSTLTTIALIAIPGKEFTYQCSGNWNETTLYLHDIYYAGNSSEMMINLYLQI